MKDFTQKELEEHRPSHTVREVINFALEALYADKEKTTQDIVVKGLSYEELIGALLVAKDLAVWDEVDEEVLRPLIVAKLQRDREQRQRVAEEKAKKRGKS